MPARPARTITLRAAEAADIGLIWDGEVPGFGLRVLASGARTWLLKYRTQGGAQRWHRIGSFPAMTPDEARRIARRVRVAVDQGRDPTGERAEERTKARAARAAAVERLAELYAAALPGRPSLRGAGVISPRHAAAEADAVRAAITRMELSGRPVAAVTPADLLRLLRAEAARPANARRLFGAFSRFVEWCREEGALETNPCHAIPKAKRPKPVAPRSRVVPLAELARLWRGAEALPETLRDLARALIALPVRRGEAARMDWLHLDLAAGTWTLPGAITKNGDAHRLALPPLFLDVLCSRCAAAGEPEEGLVFPAALTGREVTVWSSMKRRLGEAAGFEDWTWHDFRRSFASLMAERGVAEPVADAVLNHRQSGTRGGVLGVYQHARRWPEQAAAMRAWGEALALALDPKAAELAAAKVERLDTRRATKQRKKTA